MRFVHYEPLGVWDSGKKKSFLNTRFCSFTLELRVGVCWRPLGSRVSWTIEWNSRRRVLQGYQRALCTELLTLSPKPLGLGSRLKGFNLGVLEMLAGEAFRPSRLGLVRFLGT